MTLPPNKTIREEDKKVDHLDQNLKIGDIDHPLVLDSLVQTQIKKYLLFSC